MTALPGQDWITNLTSKAIHHFKAVGLLVPFPLEYALYRIFVSPVSHSRASRNPELEAAFQYQQIYLETVLAWAHAEPRAGPQGPQQIRKPSPGSNLLGHPRQPPRSAVRSGSAGGIHSHPLGGASPRRVRPRPQPPNRCCVNCPGRAGHPYPRTGRHR